MNLNFHSIRFQNINSFGNVMTEIGLDAFKRTLVVGKNGAGKSSAILDTLCFALYGRPYRKLDSKNDLINTTTGKALLVEVDFSVGNTKYLVRRGMKPNVFEIFKDGVLVPPKDAREYQADFEENVIGMNIKTFMQNIVLGMATYVPFMEMKAEERRRVTEDILDLEIVSEMKKVLKVRADTLKVSILDLEKRIAITEREIEVEEKHIAAQEADTTSLILEHKTRLHNLQTKTEFSIKQIESHEKNLLDVNSLKTAENELREHRAKIIATQSQMRQRIREANQEIEFYKAHENCPTCRQSIDESFRQKKLQEAEANLKYLEEGVSDAEKALKDVDNKLVLKKSEIDRHEAVQEKITAENRNIDVYQNEAQFIIKQIKRLKDQSKATVDASTLNTLKDSHKKLLDEKQDLFNQGVIVAQSQILLKDDGIKAAMISQYLPVLNSKVNEYLEKFDLFVNFEFDSNFDVSIKADFVDIRSYNSFSQGEKQRLNLAVLFAWRDLARLKANAISNILVFDEVLDSSMDDDGCLEMLNMFRLMTNDVNTFVVSHRGEIFADQFDRTLKFSKRMKFSQIEEVV